MFFLGDVAGSSKLNPEKVSTFFADIATNLTRFRSRFSSLSMFSFDVVSGGMRWSGSQVKEYFSTSSNAKQHPNHKGKKQPTANSFHIPKELQKDQQATSSNAKTSSWKQRLQPERHEDKQETLRETNHKNRRMMKNEKARQRKTKQKSRPPANVT